MPFADATRAESSYGAALSSKRQRESPTRRTGFGETSSIYYIEESRLIVLPISAMT